MRVGQFRALCLQISSADLLHLDRSFVKVNRAQMMPWEACLLQVSANRVLVDAQVADRLRLSDRSLRVHSKDSLRLDKVPVCDAGIWYIQLGIRVAYPRQLGTCLDHVVIIRATCSLLMLLFAQPYIHE